MLRSLCFFLADNITAIPTTAEVRIDKYRMYDGDKYVGGRYDRKYAPAAQCKRIECNNLRIISKLLLRFHRPFLAYFPYRDEGVVSHQLSLFLVVLQTDVVKVLTSFSALFFLSQVGGTASDPITIRGAPGTDRENVVIKGEDDEARIIEILHSYYVIEVNL